MRTLFDDAAGDHVRDSFQRIQKVQRLFDSSQIRVVGIVDQITVRQQKDLISSLEIGKQTGGQKDILSSDRKTFADGENAVEITGEEGGMNRKSHFFILLFERHSFDIEAKKIQVFPAETDDVLAFDFIQIRIVSVQKKFSALFQKVLDFHLFSDDVFNRLERGEMHVPDRSDDRVIERKQAGEFFHLPF